MVQNNLPNNIDVNLPNNMDVVVVIDKEKLPEDIRKKIEENLPKDVQDKIFEMLQKGKKDNITSSPKNDNKSDKDNKSDDKSDNKMFAIQTGTVVGNIYTDNIYKREEDTQKSDIKKIKKDEIESNKSGGCC